MHHHRAMLCFCSNPDRKDSQESREKPKRSTKKWKSGEDVGKLLSKSGVRAVVVNACESANSRSEECGGNLAATLISHGMQSVVAMSFKVVDEAVEIFTNVFYSSLLLTGSHVEVATQLSRQALLHNQQRRAAHMYSVPLMDYIVPILYRRPRNEPILNTTATATSESAHHATSESFLQVESLEPGYGRDTPDEELIGRDADILEMENALSAKPLMLLSGQGGCGKTALMRFCTKWWKRSGWIRHTATINFVLFGDGDEGVRRRQVSFLAILDMVADKLGMPSGHRSEEEIVAKLQGEPCLLVLDSLESLSARTSALERITLEGEDLVKLREFVLKASEGRSRVVLVSRHVEDPFLNDEFDCNRYQLSGLAIIPGVRLFEKLAYGDLSDIPETLRHRQNIDIIRRLVILLEGNPAVLRRIAPDLRRLGNNLSALHDKILLGVLEEDAPPDDDEGARDSRFAGTVAYVFAELERPSPRGSLVMPAQVAPFWTIAPRDPRHYYWFLFLESMSMFQEGSYATWLTEDFRIAVGKFEEAQRINMHWGFIFDRFISAGLAERATMKTSEGTDIACYHLHPMVTLVARAWAPQERWPSIKFAFVRQFLLWVPKASPYADMHEISSIMWDGLVRHDDYVENLKVMATAFSLEGPGFEDEVKRMGMSLFDLVHMQSLSSFQTNSRRSGALLPFVQQHLERIFQVVDNRKGGIPNRHELEMIMNYSWESYNHEKYPAKASDIVVRALEAVERVHRQSSSLSRHPLTATQDFTLFQLRYAEACIADRRKGNIEGMEHFQRNLERDVAEDHPFYAAIRRMQFRNLQEWISCAWLDILRDKPKEDIDMAKMQLAKQLLDDPNFREGGYAGAVATAIKKHPELFDRTPIKDHIAPLIEANPDAIARFGKIAHRILDESFAANMADIPGGLSAFGLATPAPDQPGSGCSSSSKLPAFEPLPEILRHCEQARTDMAMVDAQIHMIASQTSSAEAALADIFKAEAPTSTNSGGWKRLAEIHSALFRVAVPWEDVAARDYRKGLRHLDEYWRLLEGESDVPSRQLVYVLVDYAVCYNGIGRVLHASRAVLRAVPLVGRAVQAGECVNQMDAEEFDAWVYERFAELHHLDVFLDRQILTHPPAGVEGLNLMERSFMLVVMTRAKQIQQGKKELHEAYLKAQERLKSLTATLARYDKDIEDKKRAGEAR